MEPRVYRPQFPARVLVAATLIGIFLIAFLILAVWNAGRPIQNALMSGTVVTKEFVPAQEVEQQITLGRDGAISTRKSEGEFILTVEVPQPDGTKKTFHVWLPNRQSYDRIKVGDSFDVGPYLVPSSK